MVRPKKEESDRMTDRLVVVLTAEQMELIRRAVPAGLLLSQWVRSVLLAEAAKVVQAEKPIEPVVLCRRCRELGNGKAMRGCPTCYKGQ